MKKLIAKKPHLKIQDHMTMIDKGKKRTLEEWVWGGFYQYFETVIIECNKNSDFQS
jgi:hypothetical protein